MKQRRWRRSWSIASLLLGALIASTACGSTTVEGSTTGSGGAASHVCPNDVPTCNTSCAGYAVGLACYGGNGSWTCESDQKWQCGNIPAGVGGSGVGGGGGSGGAPSHVCPNDVPTCNTSCAGYAVGLACYMGNGSWTCGSDEKWECGNIPAGAGGSS